MSESEFEDKVRPCHTLGELSPENLLPGGLRPAGHAAHSNIVFLAAVHGNAGGLAAGFGKLAVLHLAGLKRASTTGTPWACVSLLLGHFW